MHWCMLIQQAPSVDHPIWKEMPSDISGGTSFPKLQTVTPSTFCVFIQHKQLINSNTR